MKQPNCVVTVIEPSTTSAIPLRKSSIDAITVPRTKRMTPPTSIKAAAKVVRGGGGRRTSNFRLRRRRRPVVSSGPIFDLMQR
jgi:hypothetical protein